MRTSCFVFKVIKADFQKLFFTTPQLKKKLLCYLDQGQTPRSSLVKMFIIHSILAMATMKIFKLVIHKIWSHGRQGSLRRNKNILHAPILLILSVEIGNFFYVSHSLKIMFFPSSFMKCGVYLDTFPAA